MIPQVILPQTGVAFALQEGELLEVIDPYGEQVADLFCVDSNDCTDALSSGRSIDYNETIRFSNGHTLFSNSGKALMRILQDSCGTHDFLVTPCSLQMFRMMNPVCQYHPSCQENLAMALSRLGVQEPLIGTTFNIFMNVPVSDTGGIKVLAPLSRPGDRIVFEALRGLLVGLTACSDPGSNNGVCKPIHFKVHRA